MKDLLNSINVKQAVNYIQKKDNKATVKYSKQIAEEWNDSVKARSFFSSRVAKVEVLEALRYRTLQVVEGKLSKNEARAWIKEFLKTDGKNALAECGFMPVNEKDSLAELGSTRRINLIIEENTRQAYAVGEYSSYIHEYSIYPYLQYNTRGDLKVRSSHALLNKKIYSVDDPIWGRIYPPNDFGCRCYVTGVTLKEAEGKRISTELPEDIDADNPLSKSGYSFDVTKGMITAQQEKELWTDALKFKYRNDIVPFMKSQADFLDKRKTFWLEEAVKAESKEYMDFCTIAVKDIQTQIDYCRNYTKNITITKEIKKIIKGTKEENTIGDAKMFLLLNTRIKTKLNYQTKWHRDLLNIDYQKYIHGKGRKSGSDIKRLTHIGQAVYAIKNPDIIYRVVTDTGLVQHIFCKSLKENSKIIVFTGIHHDGRFIRSFYIINDKRLSKKIKKEHWIKIFNKSY